MYITRIPSELGPLPGLLATDGIADVPNIYSAAELVEINAAIDPFLARRAAEARSYVWPDDMLSLGIFEKILSPAMQDVLFSVMPDPVIYHMLSSEIAAGSTRSHVFAEQPGGWHRDPDCSYYADDPTHISVTVYLTPVSAGDGTFEIATALPDQPLTEATPVVSVTGGAGRSFVWHRSFYHRAAPNTGPLRRRIVKFSIQRNAFLSTHLKNHFFRRTLAEIAPGNPRLDVLLGRYQGTEAPLLPAERPVATSRAKSTGAMGPVANERRAASGARPAYAPRDPSDLGPLPHLLARDGLVRLPDLLTIGEVAEINAKLNPFFRQKTAAPRAYAWADDLLRLGLLDSILSEKVKDVLFSVMPDPVLHHLLVSELAGNNRKPAGAPEPSWQRDTDGHYVPDDPTHVSLYIYLSETGLEEGAMEVAAQQPVQPPQTESPVISMPGSAGLSFVLHRGFYYRERPNAAARRRRLIKIAFQRNHFESAGLKQPHFAATRAAAVTGDAEQEVLFGRLQGKKAPERQPRNTVFPLRALAGSKH